MINKHLTILYKNNDIKNMNIATKNYCIVHNLLLRY